MFEIISNINLGLLTFFVPWAFFLFSDIKEQAALDKNILFDHVIRLKGFIIYTFIIFLPLFPLKYLNFNKIVINSTPIFSNIETILCSFSLIIWLIGLVFFIRMLCRSYSWVREDRYRFRFSYLKELENKNDIVNLWNSVWLDYIDTKDTRNEIEFIDIFFKKIDELKYSDNITVINKLIEIFDSFFDKRNISIFIIIRPDFLKKILELHFWAYENEKYSRNEKHDQKDNNAKWFEFHTITQFTSSIFKKITIMSFQKNLNYSYFKIIKEYINDLKNMDKDDYIATLIDIFFRELVTFLEKNENPYHFLDYFPDEWAITNESVGNKISINLYNLFFDFVRNKLNKSSEEISNYFVIDNVILHLFPEFDPRTLSWIISLLATQNSVEFFVKNGKKFGFSGRVYASEGSFDQEKYDREQRSIKNNTIEFFATIYKSYLTLEKINSLISDLNKVDVILDNEIFNKERLTEIFNEIKLAVQGQD